MNYASILGVKDMVLFNNRIEAASQLAEKLKAYQNDPTAIVLALPRGGVVLGHTLSRALHLPLEIVLVRKLGVPWHEELAFGAIAMQGIRILNQNVVDMLRIRKEVIERVTEDEKKELERRNRLYRQGRPFPNLENKVVILVDDGIATGATLRAALAVLDTLHPKKIIVAAPLASRSLYQDMAGTHAEFVILETPEPFYGIGMWYGDFPQVSDEEVIELLNDVHKETKSA